MGQPIKRPWRVAIPSRIFVARAGTIPPASRRVPAVVRRKNPVPVMVGNIAARYVVPRHYAGGVDRPRLMFNRLPFSQHQRTTGNVARLSAAAARQGGVCSLDGTGALGRESALFRIPVLGLV